jgi:hypothetical protein
MRAPRNGAFPVDAQPCQRQGRIDAINKFLSSGKHRFPLVIPRYIALSRHAGENDSCGVRTDRLRAMRACEHLRSI